MSRLSRRRTALQLQQYRRPAALRHVLFQVANLESVVTSRQHDLLQDGLLGRPQLLPNCLSVEDPLHLADEAILVPRGSAVLKGLYRVEKPEVEDVAVWAVRWLVDELDVEPSALHASTTSGSLHNLRIHGDAVGWDVILLGEGGSV